MTFENTNYTGAQVASPADEVRPAMGAFVTGRAFAVSFGKNLANPKLNDNCGLSAQDMANLPICHICVLPL